MLRKWLVQQRLCLFVGAAITLAATIIHGLGWTTAIEWHVYDRLVRHCSSVPASNGILHVDLDDDALTRFGSWPWPRDVVGQVVRILHELEAKQIVLDFLWTEPRSPEIRLPNLDPYAHLEGPIEQLGEISPENIVNPDDELAKAIRESGTIYMALFDESGETSATPINAPLAEKMADLLRRDFSLTADAIAQRLQENTSAVEAILARVKRDAARELVASRFNMSPAEKPSAAQSPPTPRQIHEALLTTPFDRPTADRQDILAAYDRELGLRNLRVRCQAVPAGLAGKLPVVREIAPPLHKLTATTTYSTTTTSPASNESANIIRPGFANWQPEHQQRGNLRAIPLMWDWNGLLIEQLGFAAARDALGINPDDMSIDHGGYLRIAAGTDRPTMRIQLDKHGQMLINWHVAPTGWQHCFMHLPITQILRIHEARQRIHQNNVLREIRMEQAVRTVNPKASAVITKQERSLAIDLIRQTWAQLVNEPNPADPEIAKEYKQFKEANRLISEVIPEIDATNAIITEQEKRLLEQLRPAIADKTCFVGYTATAVADMIHTPAYERVPGVLIHSQVYNSLLQNRFRCWAGTGTQMLTITILGIIVTLISAGSGPRASLLATLAIIAATLTFGALVLFARLDFYLPLTTALLTSFVLWAMVVMIRYLVTDRQRRWFSRAVSRYVSPAMARQIGESANNLTFDPVNAVVTCFFSDLAGFTALSEKLGPQGTRDILNPYLEMMSSTLHRHKALINKFMGDGIFAFFNPPILPCPNHATAACEAALACQDALADLISRHADTPLADRFRQLSTRIGIASGPAFVGDYGSEDKLDYTCMGDIVNLAARLESANKQFGTKVMVAGHTHDVTADRFVFRFLGQLQVKGQTHSVPVYELVGWRDHVLPDEQAYADLFTRAVKTFGRRDWAAASTMFEECLHLRHSDMAISRYLALIHQYQTQPPPEDWQGTLELTEK